MANHACFMFYMHSEANGCMQHCQGIKTLLLSTRLDLRFILTHFKITYYNKQNYIYCF